MLRFVLFCRSLPGRQLPLKSLKQSQNKQNTAKWWHTPLIKSSKSPVRTGMLLSYFIIILQNWIGTHQFMKKRPAKKAECLHFHSSYVSLLSETAAVLFICKLFFVSFTSHENSTFPLAFILSILDFSYFANLKFFRKVASYGSNARIH